MIWHCFNNRDRNYNFRVRQLCPIWTSESEPWPPELIGICTVTIQKRLRCQIHNYPFRWWKIR
jgi:hypothetical protein